MNDMTFEEIGKMRAEAERLQLSGRELLEDDSLVKNECNGTGAEWMGGVCKVIDACNPAYILPSYIHDLRYFYGGSDQDRKKADKEWLDNALICVADRYSWYNPLRYWERIKAWKFYLALRSAGFAAWHSKKEEPEK